MSSIVVAGDTSGTVTLQAPAISGTTTLNLPATNGTILVSATGVATVSQGGTGASTLAANNVLLGNGTSAVQTVAPSTSGNVLTSNGTSWVSSALPSGGVTSLNGQTGAITNTSLYAIGSYVMGRPQNLTVYAVDSTLAGSSLYATSAGAVWISSAWQTINGGFTVTGISVLINTGTWRCVAPAGFNNSNNQGLPGLWVRIS